MKPIMRIAAAVCAITAITGCSRQVDVKIGVVAPMTGPVGQLGKDIANGAQVAVDELNKEYFAIDGKRANFTLVVEDDKGSPETGKEAAQRLIDSGVSAVFGHLHSGVTIAAAPLYAKAGIPQLSVSTNPQYTRMGLKTAFRITADDVQQGATLGRLIADKLRAKSVFMVDDGTTFGMGLTDEVGKLLKERNILPPLQRIDAKGDFVALTQKIKDSGADVVFYGGDEVVGIPLLKAMREALVTAKFVASDGMCDQSTIKNARGVADNNFYCSIAGVPPSWLSAGIGFSEMYKVKYGTPGGYSTLAYNGIHVLAQAMQAANSTEPEDYIKVMKTTAFDGKIQGTVEFDAKGDVKDGTVVIYQTTGGQLVEQRDLL